MSVTKQSFPYIVRETRGRIDDWDTVRRTGHGWLAFSEPPTPSRGEWTRHLDFMS